ncbi:MAG: ABC transporter permease [Candidatus Bathyarchaeia archaeon]
MSILAAFAALLVVGIIIYGQSRSVQKPIVRLATTTSAYDTGLLDSIIPKFESKYNVEVRVIAVGSRQAVEIAKRGDADIVLIHSRELELDMVSGGYGIHRIGLMYNDFLLVGPLSDPAGVGGLKDVMEAFRRISERHAQFISRADGSGTHTLELSIWRSIGVMPESGAGSWYIEANRGMGSTLRMADEIGAYTIVDRGTWLSFKSQLKNLVALVEGDPRLMNPYSLILTSHPHANFKGAITLVKFLISDEGQGIIEAFRVDGEPLFKPLARNVTLARELGFPDQAEEIEWYMGQEAYEEIGAQEVQKTFIWEVLYITALSLRVSLTSVLLGALVGVPLGVYLGLKRFRAKQTILRLTEITLKTFVNTLMGLPPVVAGLIVYLLFNRSGPLGFLGILYTPEAMIITQLILVIPVIVGVTLSAIGGVEREVRERALSLGATDRQAALTVIREARSGIITAIIVAFGAAISEVGGIMIAGGNIRWFTRTLTTAIVTEIELGNFNMAVTLGVILLSIAFIINLALTMMQIRGVRGLEQ